LWDGGVGVLPIAWKVTLALAACGACFGWAWDDRGIFWIRKYVDRQTKASDRGSQE